MNGFGVECHAFASEDFRKNLAIINEMIARGKEEIVRKLESQVNTVKFIPNERGMSFFLDNRAKIPPEIKEVIFNDPATIVFWSDGTKTVVKAINEPFDKEKGLAMAFMKKHLGNKGRYFETIKKYTKENNK
jgi:hypothetical protein